MQACGGVPQVQVGSPAGQAATTGLVPLVSRKTQASGLQQSASATQCWSCGTQSCGTWQVPSRHCSPAVQQGTVPEQLWPVPAQTAPVEQVPLVAPGGMSQASPAQQSPSTVQVPVEGTQGGLQTLPTQAPEQQSSAEAQAPPDGLQVAGAWQVKAGLPEGLSWHEAGAQQDGSSAPAQAAPDGEQAEVVAQRSTPAASGTQGTPSQHWSRNWQTAPGWMQQSGLAAS